MVHYSDTISTVEPKKQWSDDYHVCVLLKKEQTTLEAGVEGETIPAWKYDYNEYTTSEWQQIITSSLQEETVNKLDQEIDAVRSNRVAESKKLLEQYYADHPLFSKVHNPNGEYYAITSDKQQYLQLMITMCQQSQALGVDFTPTWNATGEQCERWTVTELQQLALEIASVVYPAVSKQQGYEKQIMSMTNADDIRNLVIDYSTSQDSSSSSSSSSDNSDTVSNS